MNKNFMPADLDRPAEFQNTDLQTEETQLELWTMDKWKTIL